MAFAIIETGDNDDKEWLESGHIFKWKWAFFFFFLGRFMTLFSLPKGDPPKNYKLLCRPDTFGV